MTCLGPKLNVPDNIVLILWYFVKIYLLRYIVLQENQAPDPLANAGLDLLSNLIGKKATTEKSGFRLNFFSNDKEEEYEPHYTCYTDRINIDLI